MTTDTSHTAAEDLIAVSDVSGAESAVRDHVSRTGADAEVATAALRDALAELHRSDDEAWRRYAVDLEEATRRFDTSVGLASARLRAERAESKGELGDALTEVADSWKARADELRVRAHIGQMDLRDFTVDAAAELDRAGQRIGTVVARLGSAAGESMASLRDEARRALDDAADILGGLGHRS